MFPCAKIPIRADVISVEMYETLNNNIHYLPSWYISVPRFFSRSLSLSFLTFLPFSVLHSPFLEHPRDGDPLGVFGHRFQGGFDRAVRLVQVVVDDAEIEVMTTCSLDFSALVACPLQFFILEENKNITWFCICL